MMTDNISEQSITVKLFDMNTSRVTLEAVRQKNSYFEVCDILHIDRVQGVGRPSVLEKEKRDAACIVAQESLKDNRPVAALLNSMYPDLFASM